MATTREVTIISDSEIQEQFSAMVPIRKLKLLQNADFTGETFGLDVQASLLQKTVLSPITKQYPPSISYQKTFLKTILKKLESADIEVCDELYEEYTRLMALSDTGDEQYYRTYTMPNKETVTLKESTRFISHGTTGLQTWPAALRLTEWAMQNKQLFHGRKVVELGCGLGLTGLIVCKTCSPTQYVFTDCHQQVMRTLQENLEINWIDVQHMKNAAPIKEINSSVEEKPSCKIQQSSFQNKTEAELSDEAELFKIPNSKQPIYSTHQHSICTESCRTRKPYVQSKSDMGGVVQCDDRFSNSDQDLYAITQCKEESSCKDNCTSELEVNKPCNRFSKEPRADTEANGIESQITMTTIDWETVDDGDLLGLEADIILAADVVYDPSIVPSLVHVLHRLLSSHSEEDGRSPPFAVVASTIRNEETYQCFITTLEKRGIQLREVESSTAHPVFYYDTSCPIKLLSVSL